MVRSEDLLGERVMNNQEAIETLGANYPDACYEQLRKAVDMAISTLEKQIPKKIRIEREHPVYGYASFCPNCNRMDVGGWSYCPDCGQYITIG